MLLAGLVDAGAVLTVVAGGQKLRDPAPLVRALRSVSLRMGAGPVRVAAACEVAAGLAVLLVGSRAATLALGASYVVFTGFVVLALTRGGVLSSCGCFGTADLPPTWSHALVTAVIAGAAMTGAPGPLPLGAAELITTAAVAACAYLVLAVLPMVSAP